MLNLSDAEISDFLRDQYGLQALEIAFLPQGGDINAAVFRVRTPDGKDYFLKLLRGVLDETSVRVPRFLHDQGIRQIIAPIATLDHQLWTRREGYQAILYPFVTGHNAFELALTERQWGDFGAVLSAIHAVTVPPELARRVSHEVYAPHWRERVRRLLVRAREEPYADPIAAQYAGLLTIKADAIQHFVQKAEQLAVALQAQPPNFVLCHSDIHAGNLLIDAGGSLYIIDWDHPIMAPKERDLMFIGGGIGSQWYQPREESLFYAGYGRTPINPVALAYYRFERIIQDIAEWGEKVLFTDEGGPDRARWLQGLNRWFSPHDVVAMAYQAENRLPPELRSPDPSIKPPAS